MYFAETINIPHPASGRFSYIQLFSFDQLFTMFISANGSIIIAKVYVCLEFNISRLGKDKYKKAKEFHFAHT